MRGGIDLGGTKIQAAVVDRDGEVRGDSRHPTPHEGGPGDVAAAMAAALREAAQGAGAEASDLEGGGVGSPGAVDPRTGDVTSARNLPDWEETFALGKTLSEDLGTSVRVGNDVQVATEGEFHLGAGKGHDSLIGVFWGTGVGGGLVLGGRPWVGRGAAGEIGHMVVRRNGARCPCGRRGCLEAYAGRAAMEARARREHKRGAETRLFNRMKHHDKPRLTSGIWERALDEGDALAESVIRRAVRALGAGIASAVNLLDPEVVILGGGMGVRLGPRLMPQIEGYARRSIFFTDRPPPIKVAELGDLGGAIGASLLVADSAQD